MRITAGRYKGRSLEAPPGKGTRPALTRVRGAIFDALRPWLEGARVLDLFAGSGAFLIEAVSRGAASGIGIDLDPAAIRTIRKNVLALGIAEPLEAHVNDALKAAPILARRGLCFDIIAVAPPYFAGLQPRALAAVDAGDLLAPEGILFCQSDRDERYDPPRLTRLGLWRERTYGRTHIAYYRRVDDIEGEGGDESGGEGENENENEDEDEDEDEEPDEERGAAP